MTNCDSIFNLLFIFETIHPFSINFASDRKELKKKFKDSTVSKEDLHMAIAKGIKLAL